MQQALRHWKHLIVICVLSMFFLPFAFFPGARFVLQQETRKSLYRETRFPTQDPRRPSSAYNGASAQTFSGEKIRTFPEEQRAFGGAIGPTRPMMRRGASSPACELWAVLTTIREPSEALRRLVLSRGWCIVVVGDEETPRPYTIPWTVTGDVAVVYLSPEEQEEMNLALLRYIPWNSFGRKNVGYLYAVKHGARLIWDFDDDNMLKFWIDGAATSTAPSLDPFTNLTMQSNLSVVLLKSENTTSSTTWNPYPFLGIEYMPCWPRGMPLTEIHRNSSQVLTSETRSLSWGEVGVLQSVADLQPDLDAIFRISHKKVLSFHRRNTTRPVVTPNGIFSPYNAQATLHNYPAFWALLLPATVSGRVSDIWRSYLAQRLFRDVGLHLGFFARPLVVHDRSSHSLVGDLKAESDLYEKTEKLIKFLNSWENGSKNLVVRMEELWIEAYERDYIQIEDVFLLQEWLKELQEAGYRFPVVKQAFNRVIADKQTEDIGEIEHQHGEERKCSTKKVFNIWFSGWHMGTLMDIPSALLRMGHHVIFEGNPDRFPNPGVEDHPNVTIYKRISNTVAQWWLPQVKRYHSNLDAREHFEFYKNDPVVASVDVFICMFPAAFCEHWLPFNRSILFLPATRYSLGRCYDKAQWDLLDKHLRIMEVSEDPRHVISASSVYDSEYLKHYTGIKNVIPLYSYSGFYTQQYKYKPDRPDVLAIAEYTLGPELWSTFIDTAGKRGIHVSNTENLYNSFYRMGNLVKHPAIVYLPYAVMSYKITEMYALGIPLFMPSLRFMRNVKRLVDDRGNHCQSSQEQAIRERPGVPTSIHVYGPNDFKDKAPYSWDSWEAEFYWLQFADYFTWPHIILFDDVDDFVGKFKKTNLTSVHEKMMEENEKKRKSLEENLCLAMERLDFGLKRKFPTEFEEAVRAAVHDDFLLLPK